MTDYLLDNAQDRDPGLGIVIAVVFSLVTWGVVWALIY